MWPSRSRTSSSGRTRTGRMISAGAALVARPAAKGSAARPNARAYGSRQPARLRLHGLSGRCERAGDGIERVLQGGMRHVDLRRGAALETLEPRPRGADAVRCLGAERLQLILEVGEPRLELLESGLCGAPRGAPLGSFGHGSSRFTASTSCHFTCTSRGAHGQASWPPLGDEDRPELEKEGDAGEGEGRPGQNAVAALLRPFVGWAEHEGRKEAADESARVPPVVHAGTRDETQHEEDDGPRTVLPEHCGAEEAAAPPAVPHHGGEEAEDGAGCAHRERSAHKAREQEADDPARREDDDGPRTSVDLFDIGNELTHPKQVEEDVQQAAMQVDGREHGPPVSLLPWEGARHAQDIQGLVARGQEVEDAALRKDGARVERERRDVGDDRDDRHEPREIEAPDQAPDALTVAPEPGIPTAAVEAHRRVHAVQLAAGVAGARSGALAEHDPLKRRT